MTTNQIKTLKRTDPRAAYQAAQDIAVKITTRPDHVTAYFVTGEYIIFAARDAR